MRPGGRCHLCKPDRSQRSFSLQVGEGDFQRRWAGDQDHVIWYSRAKHGRIRGEQGLPRQLSHPPARAASLHRSLDLPADGDAYPGMRRRAGHGKADQGTPAVEPLAADGRLEVSPPAKPDAALHLPLGQALSALATPAAQHTLPAAGAHAAEKAVDAAAIPFLGLIGPFDRANIAEAKESPGDTGRITSLHARDALRYPQAGVIFPGRKQQHSTTSTGPSTNDYPCCHQFLQVSNT